MFHEKMGLESDSFLYNSLSRLHSPFPHVLHPIRHELVPVLHGQHLQFVDYVHLLLPLQTESFLLRLLLLDVVQLQFHHRHGHGAGNAGQYAEE